MSSEEKTKLLQDKTMLGRSLFVRVFVVYMVVAVSYFAIWMQTYSVSEWMQHRIKISMYPNGTFNKSVSVCGDSNHSDENYKRNERIQQETAKWQMYNTMATGSVSLFTTFILTTYTDVFGRRFLFILSSFSVFLNIFMLSMVMFLDMNFIYLVISNVIYGLTGTSYGLVSVMYSYIADVTSPGKERSLGLLMADVAISIAGTLGSLLVGFYIEHKGFIYPMFTASGIQFLVFLVTIFVLSESLDKKKRLKPPSFITTIRRPFLFYTSRDFKGYRGLFIFLICAFIFSDMTGVNRRGTETLYQLGLPFCWTPAKIGIYATVFSFGQNVFGLTALKLFQKCISDVSIAMLSLLGNAASFIIEALATTDIMLYLVAVPAILNNLSSSLIRSTMSAMTSANQQGALFASVLVVQTLCSFVTGITDNSIYSASLVFYNGFIFFVLAGYCLISFGFLTMFSLTKRRKLEQSTEVQKTAVNEENGALQHGRIKRGRTN